MIATAMPTMIVEDVETRARPSLIECDHRWAPHLWETSRACCPPCGSIACWVKDPRAEGAVS